MAILFALGCLVSAACNDFVFALFARRRYSTGTFLVVIGIVWMFALGWLPQDAGSSLTRTLFWGIISGMFSIGANILLIEAMAKESAGICSTVYRLNMVVVVLWATIFLSESLTLWQWGGILFAVAAILCFWPKKSPGKSTELTGFLLVLTAALFRAGMGLCYKYGFLYGADRNGVVAINSLFWIFGGILYVTLRERKQWKLEKEAIFFGLLSGGLVVGIVFFMAASLQLGNASVVLPISQMSFLGTMILSVLILKECVSLRKAIAFGCGAAAVLLLAGG